MTTLERASADTSINPGLIPARLDRIGWSKFHTRMVIALGVAWVLDGLEITIATNVTPILTHKSSLGLSSASVGFAVGTIYLLCR